MTDKTYTIPNDWKISDLHNTVEIIDGDRGANYPKNDEFSSQGHCLFLNTKNVPNDSFSFEENMFIDETIDLKLRKGKLKRGDFVLTTRGTVGNYAYYSDQVPFNNVRINSGMVILRVKDELLDKQFFNFYLKSQYFKNQVITLSSGTAQPQLPIKDLKYFEIITPPLLEQQAIAAVLSSLDGKIELLREQNNTLEATAQTIFKEWFVNFNFPGSTGKLIDSELGEIPEGWRVGRLSDIADFLNGLALQKYPSESNTDYLPVVKIKELNVGFSKQSDKASSKLDKKYIVDDGDVLFSWSGSLLVVIWKYGKGALNQHLFKVTSTEYPKWFYFYWIKEHLPSFQQTASAKAVTMGHIQRHHLDDALVAIPDDQFMKIANNLFDPMIFKLINNNAQIMTLTSTRDTLLPRLMKGELRVNGFGS